MPPAPSPPTIRIAISGGGIAGAVLLHALLKYNHLDVHIFESAPQFREAGAAVGLTENAQIALDLIGPSARHSFELAGAVYQRGVHLLMAQGKGAGETVARVGGEGDVVGIVHRAAFLRELLADAPDDRMHASKKLERIEEVDDGSLVLYFADGTTHECDILVGADGIHSRVRKFMLGDEDPAAFPVPAGWWLVQVLRPRAEVDALVERPQDEKNEPGEVGWIGDGAIIYHNVLSEGDLAAFVIGVSCRGNVTQAWQRSVSAEEIREVFKAWPSNLANAVEKLICSEPSQPALYLWEHPPARSYINDGSNVALLGDAAHATTPWQGSGCGMSIEDALILATLLGRARSTREARVALQVYDPLRRPRTQRVVESSHRTGRMWSGEDGEAGVDAAKLREALKNRWDFILDFDVKEHRDEAVRLMKKKLESS